MKKLYIIALALFATLAAGAETWTLNGSNYTVTRSNSGATSFDGCVIHTVKLSGPRNMKVWYATLDLGKKNANIKQYNHSNIRTGRSTVPTMATALKNQGIDWRVGINADLYSNTGPIGTTIQDGEIIKTCKTATGWRAFGIDNYDHTAHMGAVSFSFGATLNGAPNPAPQWVNVPHETSETILYSTRWGSTTPTSTTTCVEVVLTPLGGKIKSNEPTTFLVKSAPVENKGGLSIPSGSVVLSSNNAGFLSYLKNMKVGDTYVLTPSSFSINNGTSPYYFKDLTNMMGGNIMLVSNGVRNTDSWMATTPSYSSRVARSAIGVDASGKKLTILIVEASSSSTGCLSKELADMMIAVGCSDALYWDGGGSTTMNTSGAGLLNSCSDGSPRSVANGFFFIYDPNYDPKNDPVNGIASPVVDEIDPNAPVEFFNLQGVRVENPESGIYIRRQGRSAKTVIIQ